MNRCVRSLRLILALIVLAIYAQAQNIRGTILGTVRDESGAVVRGAKVTVDQVSTGLTRTETTNEVGEYLFAQLPVGEYTLSVEQSGFKKTERTGILLQVDDKLRQDVTLAVGQLSETVAVEAVAPVTSTDSLRWGTSWTTKKSLSCR